MYLRWLNDVFCWPVPLSFVKSPYVSQAGFVRKSKHDIRFGNSNDLKPYFFRIILKPFNNSMAYSNLSSFVAIVCSISVQTTVFISTRSPVKLTSFSLSLFSFFKRFANYGKWFLNFIFQRLKYRTSFHVVNITIKK